MKINSKESIAGFPLLKIRDLLKRYNSTNSKLVSDFLSIDIEQATIVLNELSNLGYIEPVGHDEYFTHSNTLKGNALALAKAIPSITKEKAAQLFAAFMERVIDVNNNPLYLYKIEKVVLFGSFITEALMVNDIDIAIELTRKYDGDIWENQYTQKMKTIRNQGIQFSSFLDELIYPQKEILQFLKAKSKYLSIHQGDEIINQTQTKQIYP